MNKKILSAVMALSMTVCTFAGCSDLDKDGNLKEAISYETVETDEVRFKVRSDFKDISDDMGPAYSYDGDTEFVICEYYGSEGKMSAEAFIDYSKHAFKEYENFSHEIVNCGEYDVIVISFDNKEEGLYTGYTVNKKDYELSGLMLQTYFPEDKDENLIRQLALEIIESAEYIGEKSPKQTDFDCDYFSITIPDEYRFKWTKEEKANIKYDYMDGFVNISANFIVEALEDSEYTSAEEYLNNECEEWLDKYSDNSATIVEEVHPVDILGYDGFCVVYQKGAIGKFEGSINKSYAFEKDDILYNIRYGVYDYDGHEQVQADFEKLIDCIKIK